MRVASLLPMLLLWLSTLGAQNNCDIFNLTATPVQVNPVNCQFFISLDFEHVGTTNQFSVSGNGNIYGLFQYGQLPIILGPFNGNPNAPTPLEFVVTDAVFPTCNEIINLNVPPCNNGAICNISNLIVVPGACDPLGATYELLINFQTQGAANGFFEVFAGGGVSLGIFPLAALPLQLPAFPASGNLKDVIKVCIDGQPNCCETIEFDPPACANGPCNIDDLTVQTGICITDSTYELKIDFSVIAPITADSFVMWANGQLIGIFGLNQLPLTQIVTWDGGPLDELKICVADGAIVCCKTRLYPVPACINMPPCGIRNLTVQVDSCTSDSTFLAILDFGVNDPTAVDSFQLWANGNDWGQYGMDQLPLKIDSFPWNGLIFNQIRVCTGNDPGCCKEFRFLAPSCLPFGPCELKDIVVETDSCTSDSTYNITLNFNATNPGNGTFTVSIHNQLLDTFNLLDVPLSLEVPWNGQQSDFVTICILGPDSLPPGANACCGIRQFQVPDCLLSCEIFDVALDPGACNPSGNTYKLLLDFEVHNPASDSFEVWANGSYLGVFALNALPLQILNFPANGNAIDVIKICIQGNADCCKTIEFQGPDCVVPCEIFDVVLDPGACNPNSNTYKLLLDFEVHNPSSDSFEVWANGSYLGVFALNALPLQILNFPANGNAIDVIKICIQGNADCCKTIEFQGPDCVVPCEIFDVVLDPGACNPNNDTYKLILDFEVQNPASDSFEVWANGSYLGVFALNALPLQILNFPANGNAIDVIKICIQGNADCCKTIEFQGPDCVVPCEIFDVVLDPGACNPNDPTYNLVLDFEVHNPSSDSFEVWANGSYLGVFALNALPLQIPNFPTNGNAIDVIKICIQGNADCCKTIEFNGPDCLLPCKIFNVTVDPGACNPNDDSYSLVLNFEVNNPGNALFEVWANGTYLGLFPLAGLPLTIPNFPTNGNAIDEIKICINDHPDCCETIEFQGPNCGLPCEIFDLTVQTGDCNPADNTYEVTVNFQVQNPNSNLFSLWANGQFFGTYDLSQLPLFIPNFPWDGNGPEDVIKVCMTDNNGALSCCRTIEFPTPNCFGNCAVNDLHVDTGICNNDSTYQLTINFNVNNPPGNNFSLWANGQFFGIFNINDLPLTIQQFPWNGGLKDEIKVCFNNIPGGPGACCAELEFPVPACLFPAPCDIYDLTVIPGACNPNAPTYPLTFDFEVDHPGNNSFEVWVNGVYYGLHPLASLPLTLPNVPSNGIALDEIKVCINGQPNCCKSLIFNGPDCNGGGGNCDILNVVVVPGPCDPATTNYNLLLNFLVVNPSADFFDVWGNGIYLGNFPLAALPLNIPNFPSNGPAIDEIKICITGVANCCKTIQFQGPDCSGGGNCDIVDFAIETGVCTGDSTYNVKINFQVLNPTSNIFRVWANGQVLGDFNLNQLPLLIQDFPWDGGNTDVIKVCILSNIPNTPPCCIERQFPVPNCVGGGDCEIWDLQVLRTPCLCGQFFAILTFNHENGGAGGFDIVGNGNNYGNFPYDTTQPIILGPFDGDGSTIYKFAVIDHDNPDCGDDFNLGKVDCTSPVVDPSGGSAMLSLSPNPTANWLNVTALLENGAAIGQADVEIYAADGRLVKTNTVANGANFQLDVSNLPSGIYRLTLRTDSGRLEGSFVKQ